MKNPIVHLYEFYRGIIRFHAEQEVDKLRANAKDWIAQEIKQRGRSYQEIQESGDIEQMSQAVWANTRYHRAHAPLDYRLSLRVVGLSDMHFWNEPQLLQDASNFEPIIALQVRTSRSTVRLLELYPNGHFTIHGLPARFHQIYPVWTFLGTAFVAGRRQWLVKPVEGHPWMEKRWAYTQLPERGRDWTKPVLYLPNHSFVSGAHYMVEPADNGQWKITTQRESPTGRYDFAIDGDSRALLKDGYDACAGRYARYKRSSEIASGHVRREKIALYIPRQGRMTGMEAINEFTQHMRVYEPAKAAVKEATNGSNGLESSAVHQ